MLRLTSDEVLDRSQMKKITGGDISFTMCDCSRSGGGSSIATCSDDLVE